jgi:exosome complex protein LRP1
VKEVYCITCVDTPEQYVQNQLREKSKVQSRWGTPAIVDVFQAHDFRRGKNARPAPSTTFPKPKLCDNHCSTQQHTLAFDSGHSTHPAMDPPTDLPDLLEDLEVNIDELEVLINPLLSKPLATTASTLPLLDKAKLHILTTYAIESLLFSSLLVSGTNAKEHAIFAELSRLRSYFGKIKAAEEGEGKRVGVDKEAAARFIKHGLAGNDRFDRERRERERLGRVDEAAQKRQHTKFDEEGEAPKTEGALAGSKRSAADATSTDEETRLEKDVQSENEELYGDTLDENANATRSTRKKPRLAVPAVPEDSNTIPSMTAKEQRRSDRRARKAADRAARAAGDGKEEELVLPTRAPRTHSETFNALLQGPLAKKEKGKGKGRGK